MGFFDEVLRIREQGYVPTKTDVLRAKQKIRVFHKPYFPQDLPVTSEKPRHTAYGALCKPTECD